MDQQNRENTYVLEPKQEERFYPSKVEKILKDCLEERLKKERYNQQNIQQTTEEILKMIRERVGEQLKMSRYKLCYQVAVGELKGQGVRVTSKCLWDPAFDNYASYAFKNETIYAVAICFGCYYE